MISRRGVRIGLIALGAMLSAALTYLAVREIDLTLFWRGLRNSNYWYVAPAAVVLGIAVGVRAFRWQLLFRSESRPPFGAAVRALMVGQLFNSILPARAGEAARIVLLHREAGTSRAESTATAAVERVYDVFSLLLVLFAFAPFMPEVTWLRRAVVLAVVVACLMLLAFLLAPRHGEKAMRALVAPFARAFRASPERTEQVSASLTHGLAALRRLHLAVTAIVLTAVAWIIMAASYWLLMKGFHLHVGYSAAILVLVATNLALLIPALPGAIGTFEAAAVVALDAYDVERSHALAYAVVLHALNFFPFIVIGYAIVHGHLRDFLRSPEHPTASTFARE